MLVKPNKFLDRKHQWIWALRNPSSSADACSSWCPINPGHVWWRRSSQSYRSEQFCVSHSCTRDVLCQLKVFKMAELFHTGGSSLVPLPVTSSGMGRSLGGSELFCETRPSVVPEWDSLLLPFFPPLFFLMLNEGVNSFCHSSFPGVNGCWNSCAATTCSREHPAWGQAWGGQWRKGWEHDRNCCKPLVLPNTSQNHSLSATERVNKY